MIARTFLATAVVLFVQLEVSSAFSLVPSASIRAISSSSSANQHLARRVPTALSDVKESEKLNEGVLELADDDEKEGEKKATPAAAAAPFLSQGEIDQEALNPDLSDPKQARVIIYIIISLIPVLFLIPLMLGSRDLIPLDAVPPVQM